MLTVEWQNAHGILNERSVLWSKELPASLSKRWIFSNLCVSLAHRPPTSAWKYISLVSQSTHHCLRNNKPKSRCLLLLGCFDFRHVNVSARDATDEFRKL